MNGNTRPAAAVPPKSPKKRSLRRRTKFSKSADPCPECNADGLPVPKFQIKEEICHCPKCHPLKLDSPTKTTPPIQTVIISAENDSSSSRSTLKGRARSWPLLSQPEEGKHLREPHLGVPSPVAQVRRLLWRHYYPEGGWGYVVVTCCVLVQLLSHGLQLSYGTLIGHISSRFGVGIQETGRI